MVHLPNLIAFEVVARHLNFARAAEELEITPTAMSKAIKQVEERLGVRLFNRTTRSVALTEAGSRLFASFAPALAQIRTSIEEASSVGTKPTGQLRINTSYVAYATLIEPQLQRFLSRYPAIALEITIDNGLSDIVGGGFDAGIRLGNAVQRDMIAVPLGPPQELVVVGAPSYLGAHGAPKSPKDLLDHDCIRQRLSNGFLDWEFGTGAKVTTIDVRGRLVFNEMHSVLNAARAGCGLGYVFRQFAAAALQDKQLVTVLDRHGPAHDAFHVYYPSRAQMPGKLRAFVDTLRAADPAAP